MIHIIDPRSSARLPSAIGHSHERRREYSRHLHMAQTHSADLIAVRLESGLYEVVKVRHAEPPKHAVNYSALMRLIHETVVIHHVTPFLHDREGSVSSASLEDAGLCLARFLAKEAALLKKRARK